MYFDRQKRSNRRFFPLLYVLHCKDYRNVNDSLSHCLFNREAHTSVKTVLSCRPLWYSLLQSNNKKNDFHSSTDCFCLFVWLSILQPINGTRARSDWFFLCTWCILFQIFWIVWALFVVCGLRKYINIDAHWWKRWKTHAYIWSSSFVYITFWWSKNVPTSTNTVVVFISTYFNECTRCMVFKNCYYFFDYLCLTLRGVCEEEEEKNDQKYFFLLNHWQ